MRYKAKRYSSGRMPGLEIILKRQGMEHLFSEIERRNDKQLLVDLFKAYRDARRHKRSKRSQLAFEMHHERKLIALHKSIVERHYRPLPSIAFVSKKPVLREVFAADFQDRVVHHLIFNHINPVFEKTFIEDSYSCRAGKGTLYGVRQLEGFIQECSEGCSKDAYILKLDVKGYFYSINRQLLYDMVRTTLESRRHELAIDFNTLDYLIRTTIFNDPTKKVKKVRDDATWSTLPRDKSLFFAKEGCGLPIGNLTSQLFSNIYMNVLDRFVRDELGVEHYGRYVDDFVLVHRDKGFLLECIGRIRDFLREALYLTLHPKKIYLQHYSRGVRFLGAYIKPDVTFIDRRTKTAFYRLVDQINREFAARKEDEAYLNSLLSSINSYLGIMRHFATFKLRQKILSKLAYPFYEYYMVDRDLTKMVLKYLG